MKRVIAILTAALLVIALFTACGAKEVDLKAVMEDINTKYELTGLTQVEDTDGLHRYYQTDADSVKQFAAEFSKEAGNYNEIILIEAADATAAENIQKQLEARLRNQLSDAKSYNAEQVSMIESCKVKETGNCVYLIISDKQSEIVADIEAALQ